MEQPRLNCRTQYGDEAHAGQTGPEEPGQIIICGFYDHLINMNILIVDDIHPILLEKLDRAGITYNYQPDFSRTEAESAVKDYTGLVIRSKFQVDETFIDLAPHLRFIARPGAGMDNIDEEYATSKGIRLFSANDGNKDAVGEHLIGMLLSLMNNLNRGHREICSGQWRREENRGYEL